jgi:hypothetical protein
MFALGDNLLVSSRVYEKLISDGRVAKENGYTSLCSAASQEDNFKSDAHQSHVETFLIRGISASFPQYSSYQDNATGDNGRNKSKGLDFMGCAKVSSLQSTNCAV